MKKHVSLILALLFIITMNLASLAQDTSRPPLAQVEAGAPTQPGAFSAESPSEGLASATAAKKILVARGGWSVSFTVNDITGSVFEYGGKGYDTKIKYLGKAGSGTNEFLYYDGVNYAFRLAIRNQSTGGTHDMYISNNGGEYALYAKGVPFSMP